MSCLPYLRSLCPLCWDPQLTTPVLRNLNRDGKSSLAGMPVARSPVTEGERRSLETPTCVPRIHKEFGHFGRARLHQTFAEGLDSAGLADL